MSPKEGIVLRSYGMVVLAAVLWGTMGVLTKTLYVSQVGPWSVVFYRALFGAIACGLAILVVNRTWFHLERRDVPFLVLYGFLSTSVFFSLYLFTISLTAVAVAVVLLYTAPVFATLLARLMLGEAITLSKAVALVLCFIGCTLMTDIFSARPAVGALGILTGVGAAVTYALFGIMGKQARQRHNAMTIQFYGLSCGTIFLLPTLMLPGASLGPFPVEIWLLMIFLAAGPTLVARVLYVSAVKYIEASRAAIVANVEPVVASVFAFLVLGETLSLAQIVGGALVLSGSILAQRAHIPIFRRGRIQPVRQEA